MMNNQRITRIATRKATTDELEELRKNSKETYLLLQAARKEQEARNRNKIDMSKEELLWKEELHRLTTTINYRKRTIKIQELKRQYNVTYDG